MKKTINLALLAVNAIAICSYLKMASFAWAIPEEVEAGIHPAIAGSAVVWGLGALPILLVFLLVDGVWWYWAVSRGLKKTAVVASSLSWVVAIVVDFAHH